MIKEYRRKYVLGSQIQTEAFAATISLWARSGQLILLQGELGSGKSTFARAFIKSLTQRDEDFDIPSPTFSLVQLYDNTRIPVAHLDLYRLNNKSEVDELGISELMQSHLVIVEWPELLPEILSTNALSLTISGIESSRECVLEATGTWAESLERNEKLESFLAETPWQNSSREFLEGDASTRRYETLRALNKTSILMDMPKKPDGPVLKIGKPYSIIAHLAEDISAVIAVNLQLKEFSYSSPKVEAFDIQNGFAIIEDLGPNVYGRMMHKGNDMTEPMHEAVMLLANMATKNWPSSVRISKTKLHNLLTYDEEAQIVEVDLLLSWFWPFVHNNKPPENLHKSFESLWRSYLEFARPKNIQWVLRDFHSPNLIWLPERQGIERVGLIDTQDAVLGHAAYDLVSLLQDARVDIDFDWADALYSNYIDERKRTENFNSEEFSLAYAILGAQRATKILGIFARLAKRDNKPSYLRHMPRVSRYLDRNLSHPNLETLKNWYLKNLPEALLIGQK
jgi:N-acetylmuramate 1-kinase